MLFLKWYVELREQYVYSLCVQMCNLMLIRDREKGREKKEQSSVIKLNSNHQQTTLKCVSRTS